MVRLKVAPIKLNFMFREGFNSKMVRLKAKGLKTKKPSILMFQFQNGAIKRILRARGLSLKTSFNSKMVRLKGRVKFPHPIHYHCFNSKMVRLKE